MQGNFGGLHGIELLVFAIVYLALFGGSIVAIVLFLRALWRIGDGLFSISRAIASRQAGSDSD